MPSSDVELFSQSNPLDESLGALGAIDPIEEGIENPLNQTKTGGESATDLDIQQDSTPPITVLKYRP